MCSSRAVSFAKKFTDPMTKNGEFRLLTPQELNATPSRIINPGGGATGGGATRGGPADRRRHNRNRRIRRQPPRERHRPHRPGPGQFRSTTPTTPGATPDSGSATSGPTGFGGTGAFGQNGNVQVGPIAAVASRSTRSVDPHLQGARPLQRMDRQPSKMSYPRQFLRPQQGIQPGQQPGTNQGRPASTPTGSTPSSPIR